MLAALIDLGSAALAVDQCSLFVASTNQHAARVYARLGFVEVPYPGRLEPILHGVPYLVAEIQRVRFLTSTIVASGEGLLD